MNPSNEVYKTKHHLESITGFQIKELIKLNAYDTVNYLVRTDKGKFILKTYPYTDDTLALVNAENAVLLALQTPTDNTFPKPIAFSDTTYVKPIEVDGEKRMYRMLSFLEGEFLGDIQHTKELFQSLGIFLANMDINLQKLRSDTITARQWEWNIQYLRLNKKYLDDIPDAKDRNTARYFFQQFEENVIPVLPELRGQIIHNDANEWNVLTTNGEISGIIDFGDLAHSPLINELAIAITYACLDKEEPLKWASFILNTYHNTLPLQEKEIKVLYYLISARLVISVCNAAHSRKINPENKYASVNEKSAWRMLYRWLSINPIAAENQFRKAVGFPIEKPHPIEKIVKRRYQHISPILSISYTDPIYMVRSAFQYMYDAYGNTFLDAYNNIPHVGHSHPKVVEAGQRQMAKLNTNTRYLYDQLHEYAEKLLSKFPPSLNRVFFVNSGSAASDLAIRMAKIDTGYHKFMVMEHGYHGNTQTATDISDYKFNNPKGQGQKEFILKTPIPDTYRGKYTMNDGRAGKKYAQEAIETIKHSKHPIAAFISEPIVGCAGQVPLADGYLKEIYPAIRKQGGLCISDEVQTGFGRLGGYFWGFEAQGIVPDMVIIGKPMANGHPMGALICTEKVADSFSKGVEFFSSFGGNPVSCAIAASVLEVIEEENLQENAKIVGDYYKSLLEGLQKKHRCIGDVRGSGLFLGVEIVKENSVDPDTTLAHHIKNTLRLQNILISTDGPSDSVLKTKPALCFTKENAKKVVDAIDAVLRAGG